MKTKLDLTKPVTTRDGRPVTLLYTNGRGEWSVGGYIGDSDILQPWHADGTVYTPDGCECPSDLINPPEEVTLYINLYKNTDGKYSGYVDSIPHLYASAAILKQHPIKVTLPPNT